MEFYDDDEPEQDPYSNVELGNVDVDQQVIEFAFDSDTESVSSEQDAVPVSAVQPPPQTGPSVSRADTFEPSSAADYSSRTQSISLIPHAMPQTDTASNSQPHKKARIEMHVPVTVSVPPVSSENDDTEQDDSADDCLICYDSITVSGDHRAVCLKCGHIFGHSCITKWLNQSDKEKRNCPQCKLPARLTDIRILYCKRTIRVLDNSDAIALRKDLNATQMTLAEVREKNSFAELRVKLERDEKQRLLREKTDLERMVAEYRRQFGQLNDDEAASPTEASSLAATSTNGAAKGRCRFLLNSVLDFGSHTARVMAHFPRESMLVISHKGDFGPFKSGSALKLVCCSDFKTTELVPLSCGDIKDISVHNQTGTALIASVNNTLTLFNLSNKAIIHQYKEEAPVWSTAWHSENSNYLYCGLGNGLVSVYDVRKLSERVATLRDHLPSSCARGKPVHTLTHMPRQPGHAFPLGGLLLSSLDRTGFYNSREPSMSSGTFEYTTLLQTGCLQYACAFDKRTRLLSTSLRPGGNPGQPRVRHSVLQLNYQPDTPTKMSVSEIHQVQAGTTSVQMLRTGFVRVGEPSEETLLLAAPDETSRNLLLWDLADAQPKQQVRVGNIVYDLCSIPYSSGTLLALTLEKSLQIYCG